MMKSFLAGLEGEARRDMEGRMGGLEGRSAIYHCMSRIVNGDFVLKREEREEFVRLMRLYEEFCEVQVIDYCVMSNHFHLLLEVPAPPACGGTSWSDEQVLAQYEKLYSGAKMKKLRWELEHYRSQNNDRAAEAFRARCFARLWDLSEYMKSVKQCFTQWFNRKHGRRGVLWEDRFKNELVEEGHGARRVAAYIDLNPVRAGIVKDPKDYRWSGYGEAVVGGEKAREGLRRILFEEHRSRMNEDRAAGELPNWKEVQKKYRVILFEEGEISPRDEARGRAGIPKERVAEVLKEGGKLKECDLMWCRTRYFVDGLVLGSEKFVTEVFALMRGYFGTKRRSGARRIRGVETSLCTMRDLQKDAVVS